MKPKTRIILLSVISILIVVTIVLGVTYSFMQANIDSSEVTEVTLSSCAKITLSDTEASIDLSNTSPISKNRALETTPYTFTVTSSCESYVGFNLYLATLNTNTLVDSSIHYIITSQGSKDILAEGILSEVTNALSEFTSEEQTQLNSGINGTFATIYRLYNDSIPLQGEISYDLYLYIDSDVTDASTMGKTFNAGIAVKSYDREAMLADVCNSGDNLANCIKEYNTMAGDGAEGIYYHDGQGTYTNANQEAGDNSYRFSGGDYELTSTATSAGYSTVIDSSSSESTGLIKFYCNGSASYVGASCGASNARYYTVAGTGQYDSYQDALDAAVSAGYLTSDNIKNFVCFGTDTTPCPEENLYRIVGIYDGQIKLIKYTYANTTMLGTDGDYYITSTSSCYSGMRNDCVNNYWYFWNNANYNSAYSATGYYNVWSYSALNTVNLNTNYINYLGEEWASKIATHTWKVGGTTYANVYSSPVRTAYQNEIVNPNSDVETEYSAKIGLMYASDYGYATDPSNWSTNLGSYNSASPKSSNWMYMGDYDWTISRRSDGTSAAFLVNGTGNVNGYSVGGDFLGVRPSFYLESSVMLSGGTGSASDPYRIA